MTIVLKYTTENGTQEQVKFKDDVVEIDLSFKSIQTIDLAPLATCSSLQKLYLAANQLQTIDLAPLATCSSLQGLSLVDNQLQTIDLAPLVTCSSLQNLWLGGNELQAINLAPLKSCASLQGFGLEYNKLQTIDLTPLATCSSLKEFDLRFNELHYIDAVYSWLPLSFGHILFWSETDAVYKRPTGTYTWQFLHSVTREHRIDQRVQQDILVAMNLGDYGFIDNDLSNLFRSIPVDTPVEVAREQVVGTLVAEIVGSVTKEAATTGLKLEKLLLKHGEIASNAQKIIKHRTAEIERVRVLVKDNAVDLRELYLTAYGYEILTALGMHLSTDSEGLEQVRNALSEQGFELKTGETSASGVMMSDELKKAIWWITKYRGRPWIEIKRDSLFA